MNGTITILEAAGKLMELPASSALRALDPDTPLYHEEHGLRHPLGVYSTSLAAVAARFERVLSLLPHMPRPLPHGDCPWEEELLERYDQLLDALMEHINDLDLVLLCFYPNATSRNAAAANRRFRLDTEDYRRHIGLVDNRIKHEQGRLRFVLLEDERNEAAGYYVEGADKGVVGPDVAVHRGGRTAFSFARDLRLHLASVVFSSEALAEAIGTMSRSIPTGAIPVGARGADLSRVVSGVANLADIVFPARSAASRSPQARRRSCRLCRPRSPPPSMVRCTSRMPVQPMPRSG